MALIAVLRQRLCQPSGILGRLFSLLLRWETGMSYRFWAIAQSLICPLREPMVGLECCLYGTSHGRCLRVWHMGQWQFSLTSRKASRRHYRAMIVTLKIRRLIVLMQVLRTRLGNTSQGYRLTLARSVQMEFCQMNVTLAENLSFFSPLWQMGLSRQERRQIKRSSGFTFKTRDQQVVPAAFLTHAGSRQRP